MQVVVAHTVGVAMSSAVGGSLRSRIAGPQVEHRPLVRHSGSGPSAVADAGWVRRSACLRGHGCGHEMPYNRVGSVYSCPLERDLCTLRSTKVDGYQLIPKSRLTASNPSRQRSLALTLESRPSRPRPLCRLLPRLLVFHAMR